MDNKMRKELQENLPVEEANKQARVMSETIGKIAKDIEPGKLSNSNYVNGKIQEFEKGMSKANPELSSGEVIAAAKSRNAYLEGKTITKLAYDTSKEIEKGPSKSYGKVVYLTIDDGPSQYTDEIIKILNKSRNLITFKGVSHEKGLYND